MQDHATWQKLNEEVLQKNKVTPSAGLKCTNYSSRLLQWLSALLQLVMAVPVTQASVGLDQNKRPKKTRDLMYLSKQNLEA